MATMGWSRPEPTGPVTEVRRLARHGYNPPGKGRFRWRRYKNRSKVALGFAISKFQAATPSVRQFVSDHWISVSAVVCGDWAAWLWNAKSGLITLAVLLVIFEIKVSKS